VGDTIEGTFPPATDDAIQLVTNTAIEYIAAGEIPLGEGETTFGRNVAQVNRLAVMGSYMPTVLQRLAHAERAIAEMRGERGCVCEMLAATETEAIDLREQLQAAVELNQIREEQLREELARVTQVQAQCAAMREALEAVEWEEVESWLTVHRVCPLCGRRETNGHAADCEIAVALAPDAGRMLLEEVQQLREAAKAVKNWRQRQLYLHALEQTHSPKVEFEAASRRATLATERLEAAADALDCPNLRGQRPGSEAQGGEA